MFWGPWADGQSTRDQITSDRRSSRGDEWSIKIFNCSQNFTFARFLAKFKPVLACSCSPNFCVARKLAIFFISAGAGKKMTVLRMLAKTICHPFKCVLCIPWILSGNSSECWLHACDACVITTWRSGFLAPLIDRKNGHLSKTDNGHFWNRQLLLWKIPQKGNEVFSTWQ